MIVFSNDGEIDPRSVTAFGVSAKEPGAIGYFGTGLKYAIAILLRTGHKVTIYTGTKVLKFGTRKVTIRGKEFDFITINGRRAEFTTEVGKTWQVWQAFRELYCNALDEKGTCFQVPVVVTASDIGGGPQKGKTFVLVEGDPIEEEYTKRDKIVLSSEPIEKQPCVEVHPGPSTHVYYKGIRAFTLPKPSAHTYNITSRMELTEDRTFSQPWWMTALVVGCVESTKVREIAEKAVLAPEAQWESGFSYPSDPSNTFREVVQEYAAKFDPRLSVSAQQVCKFPLDESVKLAQKVKLDQTDQTRLATAIEFCRGIGCNVDEYPITVVDSLGANVLGCAANETIYLSQQTFREGTKNLAGTLLEEFFHLRHNQKDETRTFQNFLLSLVLSVGERALGVVL